MKVIGLTVSLKAKDLNAGLTVRNTWVGGEKESRSETEKRYFLMGKNRMDIGVTLNLLKLVKLFQLKPIEMPEGFKEEKEEEYFKHIKIVNETDD